MNNFLEEIRRSKDNGARMLNYNTNNRQGATDAPRPARTRPTSLSSLIKENMQDSFPDEEDIFKTKTDLSEAVIEVVSDEDDMDETMDDDFVPDDDFLKKYYYDDDKVASPNTSEMSDTMPDVDSTPDDEEWAEETESVEVVATETNSQGEDATRKVEELTEENVVTEKPAAPSEKTTTESEQETVTAENEKVVADIVGEEKIDKIVSNVCINIGGNSSNTQQGFVGVQLTMTEKPVEPAEPPKRKRGRPPKKKK